MALLLKEGRRAVAWAALLCLAASAAFSAPPAHGAPPAPQRSSPAPKVALPPAEQSFLNRHPRIALGISEDWEPYVIRRPSGALEGFDVDLLGLINAATGSNLQMVAGQWKTIVEEAKARKLDGLALSASSKERSEYFLFSNPYLTVYPAFVVAAKNQRSYAGIADFAGEKVAVLAGNRFHLLMLAEHPRILAVEYPTDAEAIGAVLEGRAAAAVIAAPLFDKHDKSFSRLLRIGYVATEKPLRLLYSIRNDWPELVSIVNKGLAAISAEEFNRIHRKWFGSAYSAPGAAAIDFSADERAWLAKGPVVRVHIGTYRPYYEFTAGGGARGMAVDYLNAVAERAGFTVDYVSEPSWSAALDDIRARRTIDLLPSAYRTAEREEYLTFTRPYLESPSVIFARQDSPFVGTMDDLKGKTIVVERGYVTEQWLRARFPAVRLLEVETTDEALQALAAGKADAYIGNLTVSVYLANLHALNNLKVMAPSPFGNDEQAMAVRSDWPELASIIDKTLATFTAEEHAAIRHRWLSVQYEYGIGKETLVKWVGGVGAVLLAIIAGILAWNARLSSEVAARTRAEALLAKSEEKYRTLFERSADAFLIIEGERFVDCNEATVKMLGYATRDAFLTASPWELSPATQPDGADSVEKAREMMAVALAQGSHRFEWEHRRANGEVFPVEVLLTAIAAGDRPVLHVVWRDISMRRQADEALRQLTEDLSRKNQELERFTYTVSHDLKSPLITIQGFAGMLEQSLGPRIDDETRSSLGFILSAARKMYRLLDSLLEMSRVGRVVKLEEDVALGEVAREALDLLAGVLPPDQVTVEVAADLPCVRGDRVRLRQVMQNLLENAVKYMGAQPAPRIEVGMAVVQGKPACFVRDNGLGVPPEHQEKVFGLFARLNGDQEGTGLGLTLVRRIVELHGGKVWLESSGVPGEGSTVWLMLPWQNAPGLAEHGSPLRPGSPGAS